MKGISFSRALIVCGALSFSMVGHAATAPWQPWVEQQAAGRSTSPTEAYLLVQNLVQPTAAVSPEKARFWGVWHGWLGSDKQFDLKIVVAQVLPTNEVVVQYSLDGAPGPYRRIEKGAISSDGISFTLPTGAAVQLRLRNNYDEMEVMGNFPNKGSALAGTQYGVLKRQPVPSALKVGEDASGWPELVATFKALPSRSPVKSAFPQDVAIRPPPATLSADKSRWSGKWSGWACSNQVCDTRLAVESLSNEGADIVYAYASETAPAFNQRVKATFVGNELHGTLRSGATIRYRMRAVGEVEFIVHLKDGGYAAGLLTRDTTP